MTIPSIGSTGFQPYFEAPDAGSGGGPNLPAGVDSASAKPASAPAEPSVIDMDESSLIRVKGSDKPVKFGDYGRGFQAQFTKASQRAAQLERELQTERTERARLAEESKRYQTQNQPQAGSGSDVFEALRALPYLTGEDAVNVVQSISQQINQRDQVLLATLKQLQNVQQIVGRLNGAHSNASFDSKINNWLTKGGYPAEAADLAKEIYLAYEGDNLDEEFPEIFAERWQQIESILEGRRAKKIEAARKQPFVPGRGGQAVPSKPLEIKPGASPREIADQLFGTWNGSDT